MSDARQTAKAAPAKPTEGLQDARKRTAEAMRALDAQVQAFYQTLACVPAQAPPGADRAEHGHAVQLADEAIKSLAGVGETFAQATSRLSPFVAPPDLDARGTDWRQGRPRSIRGRDAEACARRGPQGPAAARAASRRRCRVSRRDVARRAFRSPAARLPRGAARHRRQGRVFRRQHGAAHRRGDRRVGQENPAAALLRLSELHRLGLAALVGAERRQAAEHQRRRSRRSLRLPAQGGERQGAIQSRRSRARPRRLAGSQRAPDLAFGRRALDRRERQTEIIGAGRNRRRVLSAPAARA
jgi:hypothetical protein